MKGAHKGRPYQLSIVYGQETELQEGAHEGRPYSELHFSAVFSELGSNQVMSRVSAQLDAIAVSDMEAAGRPRSCCAAGRCGKGRGAKLAVLTATAPVWAARAQESVFISAQK